MADCNIPEGHTDDKSILTCHTRSSSQARKISIQKSILNSLISDDVDLALMFSQHLACKVTRRYCHLSGRVRAVENAPFSNLYFRGSWMRMMNE